MDSLGKPAYLTTNQFIHLQTSLFNNKPIYPTTNPFPYLPIEMLRPGIHTQAHNKLFIDPITDLLCLHIHHSNNMGEKDHIKQIQSKIGNIDPLLKHIRIGIHCRVEHKHNDGSVANEDADVQFPGIGN